MEKFDGYLFVIYSCKKYLDDANRIYNYLIKYKSKLCSKPQPKYFQHTKKHSNKLFKLVNP